MRKITTAICSAFENGQALTMGNTHTDGQTLWLHGNGIARKRMAGQEVDGLYITLAGWNTNTTRERLNGLDGVKVNTKQGQAYLNGKEWDGEWAKIK